MHNKIKIGITIGDPAGVGPAIIAKAIPQLRGLADFVIIGDRWVFNQVSGARCQVSDIKFIDLNNVARKNFRFGEMRAEYGKASIEYLDKAMDLINHNKIDSLVTCPISKEAVSLAGFKNFSGHTEYLASVTNTKNFAMMLLNKKLKITLVTRHIALKDVPLCLSKKAIFQTVILTYESLKKLFRTRNPRIVLCGLNPHASDNGLIGKEENRVIKPVLSLLRKKIKGISIAGPQGADIAALKTLQKQYDCMIAMYHDQALIPLKVSAGFSGVNLTLGIPFIRTSPLHGTAFDIAKNYRLANPASLIEATMLAYRCTLNQKKD
ncbi:MAG: 4-hydroxythreonine-4-phosphate dehydrogenase PdxA [Candidatus Omnitrophica bacterium]|nr:4-hydroxythreonine-4-phosphate dehydrogenase PdxA [Candidatus Omnitrophota bacterium]MDD5591810.1 4-hydroxythreonine-4-phosphate dehydrogenase PdxA [Candidatus Omnitrophota bacterium]